MYRTIFTCSPHSFAAQSPKTQALGIDKRSHHEVKEERRIVFPLSNPRDVLVPELGFCRELSFKERALESSLACKYVIGRGSRWLFIAEKGCMVHSRR